MKSAKLLELIESTNTFEGAYELMVLFYESKERNFHVSRSSDGWNCKVMKVKKVMNGKETEYKESFLLTETGNTFVEAVTNAARKAI